MIKNAGTKLTYSNGSDPLPFGVAAGAGYTLFSSLKLAADYVKYRDADAFVSFGAEYSHQLIKKLSASLRSGYTTHYKDIDGLKGFACGAGLAYSNFNFDFSTSIQLLYWNP